MRELTPTGVELIDYNPTGNVIPMEWFNHIKLESGKVHTNAIIILSEIVYWYKPSEEKDERTGKKIGYKRRFDADKLQRSYASFETQFDMSKGEVRNAMDTLRRLGIITTELREVKTETMTLANVMFIDLDPKRLKEITFSKPHGVNGSATHSRRYATGNTPVCYPQQTNTENTNTKNTNTGGDTRVQDHPGVSATELPLQTAIQPQQPAAIPNPVQPEEPKPIRGGSAQLAQQDNGKGHLPINGYNHRQAGDGGFEGLMQAAANRVANNGRYTRPTGEPANANIYADQAKAFGLTLPEFTAMTNVLLDTSKKLNFVNDNPNDPDTEPILNEHKAAAVWFAEKGFKTAAAIRDIVDDFFAENTGFAKTRTASARQLKAHASNMKARPATPAPERTDFRGCTIVDVPTPAPTADQVADKAAQELSQMMVNIRAVVSNWGGWLKVAPGMRANWLPKIREYNAANPNTPVMFAGMEKDLAG